MSELSYLEKLLDGAEVEWFPLDAVQKLNMEKTGKAWEKAQYQFMVLVELWGMSINIPMTNRQF